MDKYLTRPQNTGKTAMPNTPDQKFRTCLVDDNYEEYSSEKDEFQCSLGKDIRSFFLANPTNLRDDATKKPGSNVKQVFDKSEDGDSDQIREKNKKRQFPDSSDEEEANDSILKIKFTWSKKQKLQQEATNNPSRPTCPIEEQANLTAVSEIISSDENLVLNEPEPNNSDLLSGNQDKKQEADNKEVTGVNEDEGKSGSISLRRSSRRCSIPARFGSKVLQSKDEALKSTKVKKETKERTARKPVKVSKQAPANDDDDGDDNDDDDDDDDVIIVGMGNSLNGSNGKVVALAPMFRKHAKMSSEELKRRKNFLMSGVPDEIRRRQQVALQNQASSTSRYAPIPRFNHTTQVSSDDELGSSTSLLLPFQCAQEDPKVPARDLQFPKNLFGHLWSESETEKPRFAESFARVSPSLVQSSIALEQLFLEIKTSHLEFPVKTIYELLKAKQMSRSASKKPTETSDNGDDDDDDDDSKEEEEEHDKEELVKVDGPGNEGNHMLWTEKYAPSRASEIIGNKAECKKVYDWLSDLKAKYSNMSEDKGSDSMDDFWTPDGIGIGGSNPSGCTSNALVIAGPHGVGKTALVYAVARELGFEVFEVNPSSAREGRQVWFQLQEATQSHQLHTTGSRSSAKERVGIGGEKEEMQKREGIRKSKSPKGKANPSLFGLKVPRKTSSISKKHKIILETTRKRKVPLKRTKFGRKGKKGIRSGYSTSAKTSLILFDEADVVFERDHGFWSAVQKFVRTTKRPIVLTVSNENFIQMFGMNIEVVNMKKSDNSLVSSYLRTMALAEGLRMDRTDAEALVESFDCDVRRCILQMQMMFSNKISSNFSILRPICYSKSSLESSSNEMKVDFQRNSEKQLNRINGCLALPGTNSQIAKGEVSKPDRTIRLKLAPHQSSMTSYFGSSKATSAGDDDDADDFVLSPATKRSRKMNRINSEDDIDQIKAKESHDDDGRATEEVKKEEFVTCDCEVPVSRIPNVLRGREDVEHLRSTRPPFFQHFFTSFLQSRENSPRSDLELSSKIVKGHEDHETSKEEDEKSLQLLSKLLDQLSSNDSTFRGRLKRFTSDTNFDLQFRKLSKPLPGESDEFGSEDHGEDKSRFWSIEEEIENSILDLMGRRFLEKISGFGKEFEQLLVRQDEGLMECQRRLTRVFEDRQSLMSDLRKKSIKNHARWNPMPEILPMLVKISENQRKASQSRRRFLHYLSCIYPSIHPSRYVFKM